MSKIMVTLNLNAVDKSKIIERTYQAKDGTLRHSKDYKIEVIPLKETNQKLIKQGDGWKLMKTHFVVEQKEQGSEAPDNIVGEGISFLRSEKPEAVIEAAKPSTMTSPGVNGEIIDVEEIPF